MKYIYIISLVLFFSCHATSNIKDSDVKDKEKNIEHIPESRKAILDSLYTLTCDTISQQIIGRRIARIRVREDLYDCLLETGFHGNDESNRQLAQIIRVKGVELFEQYFFKSVKFRGPIVFEALLLDVPHNSEIYVDHDMLRSRFYTKWDSYARNINNSIDNIDGKSVVYYIDEELNKAKIRKGPRNDEEIALLSNARRNILIEAWQSGKIILKDYGEE